MIRGNKKRKGKILNKLYENSEQITFKAKSSIGPVVSGVSRSVYVVATRNKITSGVVAYEKK